MLRFLALFVLALALLTSIAGCGDDDSVADAGLDGGPLDAGPNDAGPIDAGPPPPSRPAGRPLTQWVDPFLASGGMGYGVGSAYPSPARPFGMVHVGPDTADEANSAVSFAHCAGYAYGDTHVRGFSHTRPYGMGIPEYGAVMLMPTLGMTAAKTESDGYLTAYDKASEEAEPGYYALTLDGSIRVELTTDKHVAFHRYTFPAGADAVVLSDIAHHTADSTTTDGAISIDAAAHELSGFAKFEGGYSRRFGGMRVYFVMRFSRPFASYGVWEAGVMAERETYRVGADTGGWVRFDTSTDTVVEAAVGISFIDGSHARMNLDAEAGPDVDFDGVRAAALAEWEALLGRVEIEARSEREFRMFYGALYHTLLMPTLATDVDGSYRGLDGEVHTAEGFTYYTDFSLWDTFRTLHPWLTLMFPEYQRDFVLSLMQMARDGGAYPRWPLGIGYTGGMVGDSAPIAIADSVVKNIGGFDVGEAYALGRLTADGVPMSPGFGGRVAIEEYLSLGYVPSDVASSSASWTLEVAYADHAMAELAAAAGDATQSAVYRERARNYRNLYDPASGFLLGRSSDGTFPSDYNPFDWEDYYAEGNAWQYRWYAPHDLEGLAELYGGRAAFLERLDTFFDQSMRRVWQSLVPDLWYWHGNEPDIHAPWIYAALDRPARTAEITRWVVDTRYGDGPDGLPGNDDGGTLSAWYTFTALGLFPIAARDYYLVNGPQVTHAILHLEGGDVIIDAPDASARAVYVESATVDGVPLDRARLSHAELADGATIHFEMSEVPTAWAER